MYAKEIVDWAANKKLDIIRCGIHQPSSGVRQEIWADIDQHTNACEQTHYKSNSWGRWLTLLRAID